jgi:hypothetical protein
MSSWLDQRQTQDDCLGVDWCDHQMRFVINVRSILLANSHTSVSALN